MLDFLNFILHDSSSARRTPIIAKQPTRPRSGITKIGTSSSSVIIGTSRSGTSQHVPEEIVAQAQMVLQGKSRNLIIRELQRTNLDVNLAVNNLLSKDDEEIED